MRYALAFDGDGDQVEFPMSFGDIGTRFTLEAWVRPTSAVGGPGEGEGAMLFMHRAECADFTLEWSGTGDGRTAETFRFRVYAPSSCTWVAAESPATSTIGEWHHVAGVFDDRELRLYVDGVQVADATHTADPSWVVDVMGHWAGRDGSDGRATRGSFVGEIDEIRISASARYTGASITPPGHLTDDASTVALWLFDEGSGTTAADGSGGALDGVVTDATWVVSDR